MQVGGASKEIWLKINCTPTIPEPATKGSMEEDSLMCNQTSTQEKQAESAKEDSVDSPAVAAKKSGDQVGYDDGFKRISGTKLHVAADSNGLPISIEASCANEEEHDSARFIDVIENMSDYLLDDSMIEEEIVRCHADMGCDALRTSGIISDA